MSSDKFQIGRMLKVIPSDSIIIPTPATEKVNSAATGTTANKLVDSAGDFVNKKIRIGSIVYNTTDSTVATVTAVDSATTLSLSADIMATGENYKIFNPERDQINRPVLYVGGAGDLAIESEGGDQETLVGIQAGTFVPVKVNKVLASTTATNIIALW